MGLDRREVLAIFAGGFVGAIARAASSAAFGHAPGDWPWATFAINVVGAALLGFFATRLQERLALSRYRRPFLATGFCGALTTFSTLQVELLQMLDAGRFGLALGYAAASVAAGFAAVFVTTKLVRRGAVRVSFVLLWLAVGVFGGLGAVARFVVDRLVSLQSLARFPAGTFVINVTGSVILGAVTGLALKGDALLLAGTAVIGSYTTFSTWMLETQRLTEDGRMVAAWGNVVGSVLVGVAAAALGRWAVGG